MSQSNEDSSIVNTSIGLSCFYKKDDPNLNISSIIYTKDLVLESLINEGLDVDYINNYKANIGNDRYVFDSFATGKDDLFSRGGGEIKVEGMVSVIEE
jgi:hypothetical protein